MTSEAQELLKLIDGHMDKFVIRLEPTRNNKSEATYLQGMKSIRWLVYNFFNAPKKQEVEDAGTKDFSR